MTTILSKKILPFLMFLIMMLFLNFPTPVYADPACIHGMRIVGDQSIYLSHMGLFNNVCHDYQALFEVTFSGSNNPQQTYLQAQALDPTQNEYTLKPKNKFELPELGSGKIKSFQADIFQGQYERLQTKPKLIAADATVNIKRIISFQAFNSAAQLSSHLKYLLFGNSTEQYVAHKLTRPNDYDQILAVKTPLPLTDSQLNKALILTFPNRSTSNESSLFALALKAHDLPKSTVQTSDLAANQSLEVGTQYFREKCDYEVSPPSPANCPLSKINN